MSNLKITASSGIPLIPRFEVASLQSTEANDSCHDFKPDQHQPYTQESIENALTKLKKQEERKSDRVKKKNEEYFDALLNAYSDEKELREDCNDIINFYNKYFAYAQLQEPVNVTVRFFFHTKSKWTGGEAASDNTVRVFVLSVCTMNTWKEFDKRKGYVFQNVSLKFYFRYLLLEVLAHELFHVFWSIERKERGGKPAVHPDDLKIEDMMEESMADYFAYSFMNCYFKDDDAYLNDGEGIFHRLYKSLWFQWGGVKPYLFGIGCKKLIADKFTPEELSEDEEKLRLYTQKGLIYEVTLGKNNSDYAGAGILHLLCLKARESNDTITAGRSWPVYDEIVKLLSSGRQKEVLYKMYQMKAEAREYYNSLAVPNDAYMKTYLLL